MILVSACLLGQRVRYDGRHCLREDVRELLAGEPVLALCPEVLGGLGTPRPPARFVGACFGREGLDLLGGQARLVDDTGRDVSRAFARGARVVAGLCRQNGVRLAFLKDRSPSCGWDPQGVNPQGGPGQGVLAALLQQMGVTVREVRSSARGQV
ncbi:MAG: DUF523 domain-containing protein [Proteobacteria bacterium]|nr:DUF523 domain-containing protein [Pseudomonadota bacterium]MBU1450948.1 DUF523 domain-containing protein [Pseudomonadota bacterium]MBU2468792.1 DUF523 domain-containing protein [Pseudomonadota bacterium]MBU2517455.1 DUF523 domain-containing protein [Pseudomonadota bacterium]